jgi:hypothetical protein
MAFKTRFMINLLASASQKGIIAGHQKAISSQVEEGAMFFLPRTRARNLGKKLGPLK